MENKVTIENISKRQRTILIIYVVVLGIIGITVLLLTIFAFTVGAGAFAIQILQSIYYVIIYLITNYSIDMVYANASLLFTLLSLLLLLIIAISALGAYKTKKWGHMLNIFFLGIVFPIFFTMPTAVLWFLPRKSDLIPFAPICSLFLFLFVFDIFYFFWFMKNRNIFTA